MTVHRDERDNADAVVERLRRDLAEARQQLAATSEVLSRAGRRRRTWTRFGDRRAERAKPVPSRRRPDSPHGGRASQARPSSGASPKRHRDYIAQHPASVDRRSLIGRCQPVRPTQQITDVVADPATPIEVQRLTGLRTTPGWPMMLGTISARPERVAHRGGPLR